MEGNVFLIEKLWIDPLENRKAYGFVPIGIVFSEEEANRICNSEFVPKSKYPWPLDHANEFPGETVPRFKATKLRILSIDDKDVA